MGFGFCENREIPKSTGKSFFPLFWAIVGAKTPWLSPKSTGHQECQDTSRSPRRRDGDSLYGSPWGAIETDDMMMICLWRNVALFHSYVKKTHAKKCERLSISLFRGERKFGEPHLTENGCFFFTKGLVGCGLENSQPSNIHNFQHDLQSKS